MIGEVKVSVSLTTYNHANFIAQAIDGVLRQEASFPYELVIGDDCSTDGTREIVREFSRRHPRRIKTILPERNLGRGGKPLFALTLKACTGELIAMFDGDDYWTTSDKLQVQADFLDAFPDCSMCFHNVRQFHEDGSQPPRDTQAPDRPRFSGMTELLRGCFIDSCSPMIRGEVLRHLPPWYFEVPWGDWPLYIMAAERGRIGYIDKVMAAYRVHAGGMWSSLDQAVQLERDADFYRKISRAFNGRQEKAIRAPLAKRYVELAVLYDGRKDRRRARAAALAGLRYWPFVEGTALKRLLGILVRSATA